VQQKRNIKKRVDSKTNENYETYQLLTQTNSRDVQDRTAQNTLKHPYQIIHTKPGPQKLNTNVQYNYKGYQYINEK